MTQLRLFTCGAIVLLASLTQIATAPLLGGGADAVDIPLLVLIWFALVDRWPRIVIVGTSLVILRVAFGASGLPAVAIPLLAAVLWVRFVRRGIDPRDPVRRITIVLSALIVAGLAHRILLSVPWAGEIDGWATGLVIGTIASVLINPILDLTAPLLRSADYPM